MLFAGCWIAVNYAVMVTQQSEAQADAGAIAIASAVAIAGARQFALSQQTVASVQNVAVATARGSLPATDLAASPDAVSANVDLVKATVTVSITRTLNPVFGENPGVSVNVVSANATASTHASPICVPILDPTRSGATTRKTCTEPSIFRKRSSIWAATPASAAPPPTRPRR